MDTNLLPSDYEELQKNNEALRAENHRLRGDIQKLSIMATILEEFLKDFNKVLKILKKGDS